MNNLSIFLIEKCFTLTTRWADIKAKEYNWLWGKSSAIILWGLLKLSYALAWGEKDEDLDEGLSWEGKAAQLYSSRHGETRDWKLKKTDWEGKFNLELLAGISPG